MIHSVINKKVKCCLWVLLSPKSDYNSLGLSCISELRRDKLSKKFQHLEIIVTKQAASSVWPLGKPGLCYQFGLMCVN